MTPDDSMAFDVSALRRRLASLNDEALLAINPDELVEGARLCLEDELASRKLERLPKSNPKLPGIAGEASKQPKAVSRPASKGWLSEAAAFLVHAAIAAFVTNAIVNQVGPPRTILTENLWAEPLWNGVFAATLGFFVYAIRPSFAARGVWLPALVWLVVGGVSAVGLLEGVYSNAYRQDFESAIVARVQWDVLVLVPLRVVFYSVGTWVYIRFPVLRWDRRTRGGSELRETGPTRPILIRWLLGTGALLAHCGIALFAAALAPEITRFWPIFGGFRPDDLPGLLIFTDFGFAVAALALGFSVGKWWPSATGKWVWVPGSLWTIHYLIRRGVVPPELAGSNPLWPLTEIDVITDWSLSSSIFVRAAFYSLGAWLAAVFPRPPSEVLYADEGHFLS